MNPSHLAAVLCCATLAYADDMASMDHHQAAHTSHSMKMTGALGDYSMNRESSGTAWQPDSTPMGGYHMMTDDWVFMIHGSAYMIFDHQGGPRGDDKAFSNNMLMVMAQTHLGDGRLGFRGMFSLEPATAGDSGYPLLFQTGETANGTDPLIDRQHPHDLFMELSTSYSIDLNDDSSAFIYLGMPGEPALGPATFMHRFSGMDNPEAPISHHWLDSTHITFGVATIGYIWNDFKIEGSVFTGREPDQHRWDFDRPRMDSQSMRLSWNPNENWSAQVSYGHINSPEELEPEVDQDRITASVTYNLPFGKNNNWQSTLAWGQNRNSPGENLNAYLAETTVVFEKTHTVFGRFENVEKDELFDDADPLGGQAYSINKLSVGYIYDFPKIDHFQFGIGGLGSIEFIPSELHESYGDVPLSWMLFGRVKL